jgi:hypothetical protein
MQHRPYLPQDELDLSIMKDLDESSLNMIFDVLDLAIESMKTFLDEDIANGRAYLDSLTLDQINATQDYYFRLLDVYMEYEQSDDIQDLMDILIALEIQKNKVGSLVKSD